MKKFAFFLLLFSALNMSEVLSNEDDAKEGTIKMLFDDESEKVEAAEVAKELDLKPSEEKEASPEVQNPKLKIKKKISKAKKRSAKIKKSTAKSKKKSSKIQKLAPQKKQSEHKINKVEPQIENLAPKTEKAVPKIVKKTSSFSPKISHLLVNSVNFNDDYQATNRQNEFKNTSGDMKLLSQITFGKNFFASSYLHFAESKTAGENARRNQLSQGGGDRSFENMGIRVEELMLGYQSEKFTALAGKFLLNFGNAWRWNKSIFLTNIASSNYRESEKLGGTFFLKLGDSKKTGRYHFGFTSFTNDRKNLDNAVITSRDSDHKSDAKPGDTRSLKSYLVSLDATFDFAPQEKLIYHFAYLDMAVNALASSITPTKIDNQKSFVAGMEYQLPITANFSIDPLLEYSTKKNVGGNSDIHEDYLTAAISGKIYQHWYATVGLARRRNLQVGTYGFDQHLSEISFGYEFSKTDFFDKLVIQTGYENLRTNYKTSVQTDNVFGALMRATKTF